ncbi:hypothetical protein THAOC_07017, partial [Thalassiosira oceanica]
DGLDEHDHDEAGGDVLRVRVPDLPEGVRLALGRGGLASRRGSEELDLDEAQAGEHGHAGVLELGLSEPVEVDSDIVDVGQAEGVESDVTGHGPVEEGRAVHERQGLGLLRDLAVKLRLLPDAVRSRGKGGGRAGHGQYGCDLGNHGWLEWSCGESSLSARKSHGSTQPQLKQICRLAGNTEVVNVTLLYVRRYACGRGALPQAQVRLGAAAAAAAAVLPACAVRAGVVSARGFRLFVVCCLLSAAEEARSFTCADWLCQDREVATNIMNDERRRAVADATAGVVAAISACLAFYPIDAIKTSLMATEEQPCSSLERQSTRRKRRQSIDLLAIQKLFRGLPHKLAHTSTSSFAYFYVYSLVQSRYASYRRGQGLSERPHASTKLLLTAFAAVVNTCITLPLDTISSRRQADVKHDYTQEEDKDKSDEMFVSARDSLGSGDDDYQSANVEGVAESDKRHAGRAGSKSSDGCATKMQLGQGQTGTEAREDSEDVSCDRSRNRQQQLYIKTPSKYKFSFSTNLPEEAFGTRNIGQDTTARRKRQMKTILSLWNGLFPATLLCANPAIQYAAFDSLKSALLHRLAADNRKQTEVLSMGQAFVVGLISKFFATIMTYPLIRCKVMLMVDSGITDSDESNDANHFPNGHENSTNGHSGYQSARETKHEARPRSLMRLLLHIFCRDGIRGLYRGFSLQLLHTVLKSAMLMMVREK